MGYVVLALVLGFAVVELVASFVWPAPYVDRAPLVRVAPHPVLGYALVPDQSTYSYQAPIRTDAEGLRVLPAATNTTRTVLFLGGSETFGKGVRAEETFAARVQAARPGTRAVVAGVPDWNVDQSVTWLDRYGARYAPEVVVLTFYWNDLFPEPALNREAAAPAEWAPRAVLKRTGWLERIAPIYTRSRVAYVVRNALKGWIGRAREHPEFVWRDALLAGSSFEALDRAWARVEGEIDRFRTIADARGFRPVVLVLPIEQAVERGRLSELPSRVAGIARARGIDVVDASAAMMGCDGAYIPWDGRPSAAGHAAIAEALLEAL